MSYSFSKILIPVDFSANTEVAVKKALELAEPGTVIHLLHVLNKPSVMRAILDKKNAGRIVMQEVDIIMQEWEREIEGCRNDIKAKTWIAMDGRVQSVIEIKAKQLDIDLIIICKKSQHSWLPFLNTVSPHQLVSNTGKPVLTVKPGSIYNKLKTVVVPVSDELIEHKIDAISALSRKFKINVHLVTFADATRPDDFVAAPLLQLYQWIKNNLHCTVEYGVLRGSNKAKAILKYAERVDADMLLVYPEMETKMGWLNTQISDVLPPASKVQVLAVQPATFS